MAGRNKNFNEGEVIEKALNQFWLKGYESTSTRDLATAMEINYGSVYNSFTNKEELYLKSLDFATVSYIKMLEDIIYGAQDPIIGLKKLFIELIEEKDDTIKKRGCFLGNTLIEFSDKNGAIKNKVEQKFFQLEKMFFRAIECAKENHSLTTEINSDILSASLLSLFQGLMVYRRSSNDLKTMQGIIDLNFKLFT